jgi:CheY-like chemotaxis protein
MEPLTVLLIDDTRSMRSIVRQYLEKDFKEITVTEAANGKEGQKLLSQKQYNLILCDLDMPHMNGEEFLAWLKSQQNLSRIPIIMVTATRDRDRLIKLIRNGADGCLLKPFSQEALTQKILEVITAVNKRLHERHEIEGNLTVHGNAYSSSAQIVDISKGGLLGKFESAKSMPHILEKVTIDFEPAKGQAIKGLTAYVVRLHADGESYDAAYVKVAVKFYGLKEEHEKALHQYLDLIGSTKG